jgi:hypothetical protein
LQFGDSFLDGFHLGLQFREIRLQFGNAFGLRPVQPTESAVLVAAAPALAFGVILAIASALAALLALLTAALVMAMVPPMARVMMVVVSLSVSATHDCGLLSMKMGERPAR